MIFQFSIDTGTLTDIWLQANVSSVFKKVNKHLADNYRPFTWTSVISKCLEHIICKHIIIHLKANTILTTLSHGFRSGYSCETKLIITAKDLLKSQNTGKIYVRILDFSEAYDTARHHKLVFKLSVKDPLHQWLTNFLTKYQMRVILEGASSEKVPVISGVPQGTVLVLGSTLFLLIYHEIKVDRGHEILQKT